MEGCSYKGCSRAGFYEHKYNGKRIMLLCQQHEDKLNQMTTDKISDKEFENFLMYYLRCQRDLKIKEIVNE